jgi:hypothetical protein
MTGGEVAPDLRTGRLGMVTTFVVLQRVAKLPYKLWGAASTYGRRLGR